MPHRKQEEVKPRRQMRVVRSWLPNKGVFRYFTIYSDGMSEPASRKEAEQYAMAYGEKVKTIYGEPEDSTWNTTGK